MPPKDQHKASARNGGLGLTENTLAAYHVAPGSATTDPWPRPFPAQQAMNMERLVYLAERGLAAIRSIERLGSTEKLRQNVEEQAGELQRASSYQLEGLYKAVKQRAQACGWVLAGPEKRTPPRDGADLVPRRLVPGLLTLCTIPLQERAEFDRVTHGESPMWSSVLIFGLFWADGRRNLGEIERLVRLEIGPTDIDLIAYFRFLQRLGYIAWVQS